MNDESFIKLKIRILRIVSAIATVEKMSMDRQDNQVFDRELAIAMARWYIFKYIANTDIYSNRMAESSQVVLKTTQTYLDEQPNMYEVIDPVDAMVMGERLYQAALDDGLSNDKKFATIFATNQIYQLGFQLDEIHDFHIVDSFVIFEALWALSEPEPKKHNNAIAWIAGFLFVSVLIAYIII